MARLADLQRDFSRALLHGEEGTLAPAMDGRFAPAIALGLHRDTVMGALIGALRLSHPFVARLVGEPFFDQAALTFIQISPPRGANLAAFGSEFSAFLARYAPAAKLVYLADVARLDWAVGAAIRGPDASRRHPFPIDERLALSAPASLTVLSLDFPAAAIRKALAEQDDAGLAAIDLAPRAQFVAVWRADLEACVRPMSRAAGEFLALLIEGRPSDEALACALGAATGDVLAAIQAEVFAAPFAEIIALPEDLSP